MPQIVWTTRADGWNTFFSQRWMDYTGLTLEESLGHGWSKPFHPADQPRAAHAWREAIAEKGNYSIECRLRRADGIYRWWWILAAPSRTSDGTILKWFGSCTDIHERKRAEEALLESNVELERAKSAAEKASLAKSDFLSSMSHELRSPLNAILGFAQLMELSSPALPAAQQARVAQILQAGWHLLKLISEILDLSVIESGQISLSREAVSLAAVMTECQSMMEPEAQQRGIRLTFPRFCRGRHDAAEADPHQSAFQRD
jgi:PAS domain S-box-containing protein